VANIPARLIRAEEIWRGGACQLVVEGQVVQSTVFGERLELTRRIEVSFDGTAIKITDRVTNRGFEQTAHMLLYHINLGWPLVDEGAVVMVEGADPREIPPPNELDEVVTEHRVAATGGNGRASLLNSAGDQGVLLTWDAAAMPVFYEWRHLARGAYAVAFEPSTNRAAGRDRITRAGELIVLQHGETRTYRSRLEILPNRSAVTEALAATRGTPASAETLQSHQT
jgi:hypothetical protein